MKNDCYSVLMHFIRKVLVVVITISTVTSNFSLNPEPINIKFSLELHLLKRTVREHSTKLDYWFSVSAIFSVLHDAMPTQWRQLKEKTVLSVDKTTSNKYINRL